MYPYMQYMNPFPYQRNEMHHHPYPPPSYEAIPPYLKPYPDGCPVYHTPWPSGGMNGYPYPHLQPHGCYNPNFFPGYGHMSAHPPAHCCGGYPVHPGIHPCHLATPCWTAGPPQFEFQKDVPGFQHSSGCPNDMCKDGKSLKIEELGPRAEAKKDVSLVPSNLQDCPYPVIWFPPNYLKGNMGGKEIEPVYDKQEDAPSSTESHDMLKSSEYQPSSLNGWLPIDISKMKSSKQDDVGSGRKLRKEDQKSYFPFPFFYVPGKADEMGRTDQNDADVGQQLKSSKQDDDGSGRKLRKEDQKPYFPFPFYYVPGKADEMGRTDQNDADVGQQLKSSKQDDDGSGRKLRNEVQTPYFPFPFFYVPGKADEMGRSDQKDADVGQQCAGGRSSDLKAERSLSPELNNSTGTKSNEKVIVCQDPRIEEKKNEVDVASLKQGEKNEGKKMAQSTKEENGTLPKHVGNEEKAVTEDSKKRSPSPPKFSKLPPVCLRVDPLPKKKNGNGTSKPSSPSGNKDEPFGSSKENIKVPSSGEVSSEDESSRNKIQEQTESNNRPKRITKTIKVYDATSHPGEDVSNINCGGVAEGKPAQPAPVKESCTVPEEKADRGSPKEVPLPGNLKAGKKWELSEDEAAKLIQSTYRGYEVRKWEPLKKLRDIKTVQDEASQLKKRIGGLKSSLDVAVLDQSRTVIGEAIMNLLLKLDSIQGLPAGVRQFRKSVASELVSLQAELDALVQWQTENLNPSASVTKSEGEMETGDYPCIQEGQENEKSSQKADQADTNPPRRERCLAQLCQAEGNVIDDSVADSKSVDVPELEIEQKDTREIHEEPPLIEICMKDENNVHKEETPEVIDRYTMQLHCLWQNGNEALKDKSESNALMGGELVDSVFPEGILDDQGSGMSVQTEKAEGVIQENFVPETNESEQLSLKENDLMSLEENENNDACLSWLVPGLPDFEVHASLDLDVAGDKVDETSPNAEALSENPLAEVSPVGEVCKDMQDFGSANNVNSSAAASCRGFKEVQDLMESKIARVLQDQCAISEADSISCEDTSIALNGKHDVPDSCQEEHEHKHPHEEPGLQACPLDIEDDNMVSHNAKPTQTEEHPEKDMVSVISIPKQTDGELSAPHSPASSQVSFGSLGSADHERSVIEENERLREMMQNLIQEGQEHLTAISSLSGKVKDLEKKLSRKKKVRLSRSNGSRAASGNSCMKLSHRPITEKVVGLAN